jgi:antitoxin MazE
MKAKVSRWGNSLALRLPKSLAATHRIKEGSNLEISESEKGILLTPIEDTYDLEELLCKITTENLHSEFFTGTPQGDEIW